MIRRLDLLLVNAPSRIAVYGDLARDFAAIEPPVWAGLIAQHCLDRGFTVAILDAEAEGLTVGQTAQKIAEADTRFCAFCIYGQQPSASTQCLSAASVVVRHLLYEQHSEIPTLALGTHPSALPERTLREEPFDFVCQGEGHQAIAALLNKEQESIAQYLGDVPGLWWLKHDGDPCPVRGAVIKAVDIDVELPGQAWELLDMKRYRAHNWHLWTGDPAGGYASVQTSLGCPFRCSFCCINAPFGGTGIRYWSPDNVVGQIARLVNDHGITNIKIPDEMFCLNPNHVMEICKRLIHSGFAHRLNIWAYARIDTVKNCDMLSLLRAAGFRWLGIGIESGSKHVRDGVQKGKFGDDDIRAAVGRVRAADIRVAANYIFGLPDDTHESMQATLDLACELNTEWANFYCAMAYPGSALHAQFTASNPAGLPENNPCGWLGYAHHAYESLPLPTATLTSAEVLDFRDEAFLRYFGRSEYLNMIGDKFGDAAGKNVIRMLAQGKPRRKHREKKKEVQS